MTAAWKRAFADHRALLAVAAAYAVFAVALAVYCGVPASNLAHIFSYLLASLIICLVFLTGMYIFAFIRFFRSCRGGFLRRWREATGMLDVASRGYLEGERWAYAVAAVGVTLCDNFFFMTKSMIPIVNPYQNMKWDIDFAAWDKALHFGHYPHEFIIPLINALGLARAVDLIYALWLVVMFMVVGYNIFVDDRLHRRLRFLWCYLLSWVILGTAGAMAFSSVGPLFVHDFFPAEKGLYAGLVANFESVGKDIFLFASKTRELLIGWATNDQKFDPNTLSAMPSMHIAIAWLVVLYAKECNRWAFAAAIAFCASIFLGAVYLGFHYAVDAYVSVAVVTALWLLVGKFLDRRYLRYKRLGAA
jgi:hypothetical protein